MSCSSSSNFTLIHPLITLPYHFYLLTLIPLHILLKAEYEKAKKQEQSSSSSKPSEMPGGFPGGMPGGFPGSMPGGMPGNVDFSKILNVSI